MYILVVSLNSSCYYTVRICGTLLWYLLFGTCGFGKGGKEKGFLNEGQGKADEEPAGRRTKAWNSRKFQMKTMKMRMKMNADNDLWPQHIVPIVCWAAIPPFFPPRSLHHR